MEKQAEIDRIAEEKAALEEKNRKLEDKEYNFERLRKQKEGTIGAEVLEKLSAMEEAIRMVQERPKHEIGLSTRNCCWVFVSADTERILY